ncbi:virulence factor Mce family protein [Mycobacterium sp. HUMS_1102779]|uniref:virulence factor Mce family protein n=1 Tax=Mycobacterium sp. HUMS_1102779 TaxID=3383487 RepID=UPI003899AB47
MNASRKRSTARLGLAAVLVATLVAGVAALWNSAAAVRNTTVVGYFANSNGIFVGDEVRILGVAVGRIDKIEPQPRHAKITFSYDAKYAVPADAKAVILSPSLVTARAIQLTPAYTGGPRLRDGAVIPQERTAVPVEWDDLRQDLEKLTQMLQPTRPGGVSAMGALVNTAAANLRGQGAGIRDAIVNLSQAVSALGDHSGDIFGTLRNLSVLVSALQSSTDLMRQLNQNLASVSGLLADDPDEVANAVAALADVVGDVRSFVADNREALGATSEKLASVSTALDHSLDDVKQALHIAPTELQNFVNIYQPAQGTLSGAPAFANFANPVAFLCGAIQAASRLGWDQSAKLCVQYLAPIFKNREYNFPPLGENLVVGAVARPNEVTYSEDWMRPDYVAPPSQSHTAGPAAGLRGLMLPEGGAS